jgi:hypothetical protein
MLAILEKIIQQANPSYNIEYEEVNMMNIKADEIKYTQPFVYIEEFRAGEYGKTGFFNSKTTRVELWCCKFCQMQNDAREREAIRAAIESEMVVPFIGEYKKETGLYQPETWKWYTPPPRFDANEVSIMLQFDFKELRC